MPKKTTLNDSASIYQKREPETEKQKFKDLHGKAKVQYFRDYYLKAIIVGLIALGFIISILYTVLKPKPIDKLNVAVINYAMEKEHKANLIEDINKLLKINDRKEKVTIDDTYVINQKTMDQFSMTMHEKLTSQIYAKQIDVVICDEANFKHFDENEYFFDLSKELPADLYKKLSQSLYMKNSKAVGIRLSDCKRYQSLATHKNEDQILAIVINSKNKKNAVKFIEYLFK